MLKRIRFTTQHHLDWYLLGGVISLLLLGLLVVYDSSSVRALEDYGNQFYFLIKQVIWVVFGAVGGMVLYRINYRWFRKAAPLLFGLAIALLVLILIPSPISLEVRGSRSWFAIPLPTSVPVLDEIRFQPSEFAKLALIIYLASRLILGIRSGRSAPRPSFWSFFVPTMVTAGLVVLERDLGSALIITATGLAAFFFAGASLRQILLTLLILAPLGLGLALQSSTFLARWRSFVDPDYDPQGTGYQIRQVRITLGSGGLWGLGIGRSRQKYGYIPDIQTDAIFAVVGEEFGFLGAALVVAIFAFLIYRGFRIATRSPDEFGRILAAGITAWFAIQTILNLGAMVGILPLTGITLPLISYGGSSVLVLLLATGILLNISRQTVDPRPAR